MAKYRDFERDIVYTEEEMYISFIELKANGDTDAVTFGEYMHNCLGKNGSLEVYTEED